MQIVTRARAVRGSRMVEVEARRIVEDDARRSKSTEADVGGMAKKRTQGRRRS